MVESKYTYALENEVPQKYHSYEQTIADNKRRIADLEGKIQGMSHEIERLANDLKVRGG